MTLPILAVLALVQVAQPAVVVEQSAVTERSVRGEVRTPDGARVVGATLWVVGTRAPDDSAIAATTDGEGSYRFTLPVSATSQLLVRRRGFQDARVAITAAGGSPKRPATMPAVTLVPVAAPLTTVVVSDTGMYVGVASMFYRHMAMKRGEFVTRADLARTAPTRTSNALRGLRGVTLTPGSGGGMYVRLRSHGCYAAIWLDGSGIGARAYDVDLISPYALTGIEVYSTPGELPAEYQTIEAMNCGAVAFWTRRGDEVAAGAFEQAAFVDPANVRLSSEVESPARLLAGIPFAPGYPAEARASGVGGSVLVELVVDTTGGVERSSVGVVAAASPELAGPVLRAAERLRFEPARKAGRPVRQLVQIAATFSAGKR